MLRRCSGDIPLNISSTINSLFSSGAGLQIQNSLEAELLNDSTRNRVARFRQREIKDRPSLIFTRAGGLLNLKALLSIDRRNAKYSVTGPGAIALHANDYLDIELQEADAAILMVQMLPVWELYNPRDVGAVLRRYDYVFHDLFVTDSRVSELLRRELSIDPGEIRVDGVRVDDYLALLFGLYVVAQGGARNLKTSIVDFTSHLAPLDISREEADAFLAARSFDTDQFRAVLGNLDETTFQTVVRNSSWSTDFSLFRERPLVRLEDGRFVVADLQFLIENAAVGLFWNLFRRMSKAGRDLLQALWGHTFERYVQQQFISHLRTPYTVTLNVDGPDLEIDLLIVRGDVAFVVEAKAGMLPQDAKSSRDFGRVTAAINRKFVANVKGNPKGVRQLARSCSALASGLIPNVGSLRKIYPLLVVDDPSLNTVGMNTYLDRQFSATSLAPSVSPLTVATIDEIENIIPYVGSGDVELGEVLDERFTKNGVTAEPLNTTFARIVNGRKIRTRGNAVTKAAGERLAAVVQKKYEKLR